MRIQLGIHDAPTSITPTRSCGWRCSTPSITSALSVCITGSGIER